MKLALVIGSAVGLTWLSAGAALAEVDFGTPDFPNYISRPAAVSCDWSYDNYFRACPTPVLPPKAPKPTKSSDSKDGAKK